MKQDRLFAVCGIAFVALELAGTFIAMGVGKTHGLTISSSRADIAAALAKHVSAGVWAGEYMELLSVGFFLAFAAWLTAKLGGGLLGTVARLAAATYAGAGVVSLGLLGAIAYGAGRGLDVATGRALVDVNEAIYVATWFVLATFLVAIGLVARAESRGRLGWSALAIAAYTLVATPLSVDNFGQFSQLLALLWVVCASIAVGLAPSARARTSPRTLGAPGSA